MKKKLITTTTALLLTFSGLSLPTISMNTHKVAAATTQIANPYNNQTAVDAKADEIIATAKDLIGKATYGRNTKTTYPYEFTCATYINFIFKQNGVDIATWDENNMIQQGYAVPRDQLQKGDLVFFDSTPTDGDPTNHVGMYIGDNKIIHMANPELNVVISDLDSTNYYRDDYVGARRVLPSLLSANPATKGDQIVATAFDFQPKVTINSTTNNESTLTFTAGGYVDYIYKKNGITLGTTNIKEQIKLGQQVAKTDLQKGDLVFFNYTTGSTNPGIVGIYAGDNRLILSSPTDGVYTRVITLDYYQQHYITARRVINDTQVTPVPEQPAPTKADNIVNFATSLIGKAKFGYSYDESTLTFTPGGFTKYVYKQYGVDLKSTLTSYQSTLGQAVLKANLQKGDLVFFSTNNGGTTIADVGIYVGDNQFIHLTSDNGAIKESMTSDWATKNYVTARRVL